MNPTEQNQELQLPKPRAVESYPTDSGLRFGLNVEVWTRWWLGIPLVDREGFRFHGGTPELSRFVCAFDYLTHESVEKSAPRISTIVQAYSAAYAVDPQAHLTRVRAAEAYAHDAVQYILGQFETRNIRDAAARLQPGWADLATSIINKANEKETPLKEQVAAFSAVAKLFAQISRENISLTILRSKKSVERAERLMFEGSETEHNIGEAELASHMRELVKLFGAERIATILAAPPEEEAPVQTVIDMAGE